MQHHDHHSHSAPSGDGIGFFSGLFDVYVPRQVCMNHEADVVWMHVFSDSLIAAAYFSIPLALLVFARRRPDLEFRWIYLMFAAFIISCGITHLFDVMAIWQPMYRLNGVAKLGTGVISAATAIALWPLIPQSTCPAKSDATSGSQHRTGTQQERVGASRTGTYSGDCTPQ